MYFYLSFLIYNFQANPRKRGGRCIRSHYRCKEIPFEPFCVAGCEPLKAKQCSPLCQEHIYFQLSRSHRWKPSSVLTCRYLKLQLPCLGGCDVTAGISNVILVSRRDLSRKCLMKDEALCSGRPDVSWAARGGKAFLKSRPSLSGPGGSPRVRMNQREVTISM